MTAETVETRFLMTAQNRAGEVFNSLRRDVERTTASVTNFRGALATLGSVTAAGILGAQVKGAIDLADELNKLSQRTGITVESLSALRYQAELSGVGFTELQTALRFYNQRISDAAGGNKEALATFERMGFTQSDLQAALSNSEGFLRRVSDRFAGYADGAARSALAADIFGSRNEKMVLVLAQGAEGLDRARKELERFGGVISGDFAKKAEEFNDNLTRLSTLSQGAAVQIGTALVPKLNELLEEMLKGVEIAGGFGKALLLLGSINPFRDLRSNIASLNDDIQKFEANRARALNQGRTGAAAGFDRGIDAARKQIEFLKFQEQRAALGRFRPEETFDARDLQRLQREAGGRSGAPALPKPSAGGANQGEAFLDTLRKRLTAIELDEYAVLRLEAAQKKVAASAEPLIQQLQRETEFRRELEEARRRDEQSSLEEISRRQGLVNGVGDYVRSLEQETALMRLSNEERQVQIQLINLQKAGLDQDPETFREASSQVRAAVNANAAARIFEETRTPVERFKTEFRGLSDLLQSGALDWDTYGRAVDQARDRLQASKGAAKETKSAAEELGLTFVSAAEEALVKWEGFSSFFKGLEQDLIRFGTRKLFTEPLTKAASGLFEGSGAGIASLIKGIFGGPKAAGGPVAAGISYLVGEEGPELFTPRTSGAIVPNGGVGGGNTYNINVAVPPGTSRETAMQMAARTASMLQYARGYNG